VNTDPRVRLINDILDIERMESRQVALEKTDCDHVDRALEFELKLAA
jgi:hypothetical protein